MKKTSAFVILAVFAALLCSSLVKLGQAESISIGIYDTEGLPRDTFNAGENIRIMAESSHTPITIIVTDPDGVIVCNETYECAILGSSDGTPNQYFSFDKYDASDVSIWIQEGETWLKWLLVEDFSRSGESSRHYTININGDGKTKIQFGDGIKGSKPPAGEDNIRATYRTGGGEEGNVVAGEVISLPASIVYDKTLSGLTNKLGMYTVNASSPVEAAQKDYSCIYFKAIPEIPLGTISAVTTLLLGLSLYGLVQRRKHRLMRAYSCVIHENCR